MCTILKAVDLDEARHALIKQIVCSCRECRSWQRPGNMSVPSVSLPTKFCEEGECDIMLSGATWKIFHIIDRAIRLGDGQLIDDITTDVLVSLR